MEFVKTEEQRELQKAARRFLEENSKGEQVMKSMLGEDHDPEMWGRIAEELGWPALTIPEEYDGLGMSYLDLMPLMEETGRYVLPSPFFSTVCLGTNALLEAGTEEQKKEHLPNIAMGEATATVAYTEPNGRWDASGIEAIARRDGDDYILSGTKSFVIDGHSASLLVIAARAEGTSGETGVSLFCVAGDEKGIERRWLPTMDSTRKLAEVKLDGLRVPAAALMGNEGEGFAPLSRTIDLATAALTAEQVGGAEMCLDLSVDYGNVRQQFGRFIGSFQAIKHKCADMLLQVESARSASFYANALAAEGSDSLGEAASWAKAYCSDAYFHCAAECLQIHGGIGFTWEHETHLYFKRAKSSETLFGDSTYHRERSAKFMGL